MNRRQYIAALSSLTAAQWDAEGWPEPEGMEPIGHDMYAVDEVSPDIATTYAEGMIGKWNIEPADVDEAHLQVTYNSSDIHLGAEASGDGFDSGSGFEMTSDQARDLAVALFRAAEEKDRRPASTEETDG